MAFFQDGPTLGNQFLTDRVLQGYLERTLPPGVQKAIEPELVELGELAGGEFYRQAQAEAHLTPTLTHYDPWGRRIDAIELTPMWRKMASFAAERGLVGAAYERAHGAFARVHQMVLNYLVDASTATYSCPLAMTDGAARTLIAHNNEALVDRAVRRLTSRDPKLAWTSGQWMTERTGGSDVGISETVAQRDEKTGEWRLYGTKWFSSAATSDMALTLARPDGNPPGGRGLALFYLETRDAAARLNGILINRLKDKLGTRSLPTAELTLDGALAIPVAGLTDGVRNITPMLTITRMWNTVAAATAMRRGIALSRDYGRRRVAFGAPLAEKPLHIDTIAGMQAEFFGAFLLAFRVVELLGKEETGTISEEESRLLRILTPIGKLTTGKQAVATASEALEVFGGAGYVEDTGLPRLLRDSQVLPIWEGTTNVLSLDVLRALGRSGSIEPIEHEVRTRVEASNDKTGRVALDAVARARAWLEKARGEGVPALEAGARRFALTLGRAMQLALLVDHGAWLTKTKGDGSGAAAARRLARNGVNLVADEDERDAARALAEDEALTPPAR